MKKMKVIAIAAVLCLLTCGFVACSKNSDPSTTVKYSFSVNRNEIVMDVGDSFALVAVCGNAVVTFESYDTDVATVDSTGKITAVGAGETFVNAKADGETLACKVTVYAPEYALVLDKDEKITVAQNAVIEITALLLRDGEEKQTTIAWSVDNAQNCTLHADGNTVTFQSATAGEYVITAKCDKATSSVIVTVTDR